MKRPKPSSLAQQIKQARREVWNWPKEKRDSVQLQGDPRLAPKWKK